jgi:hypothetical protein
LLEKRRETNASLYLAELRTGRLGDSDAIPNKAGVERDSAWRCHLEGGMEGSGQATTLTLERKNRNALPVRELYGLTAKDVSHLCCL